MKRFFEIDLLRGLAVIAMVAFHVLFDLNFFAGYDFSIGSGALLVMGRFAAASFVFLAGLALTLSYNRASKKLRGKQLFKKYLLRGLTIFFLGLTITLFTWAFFPKYTIFFGVLHLIGISIILGFAFVKKRSILPPLGLIVIIVGLLIMPVYVSFPWLLWLGLKPVGFTSFDFFPLLPWFGVVLLGIFAGNTLYKEGQRSFAIPDLSNNPFVQALSFLGRNSLAIYFLHQPILIVAIILLA